MGRSKKSSISKAQSYQEIGEFWDTHNLSDYWDEIKPIEEAQVLEGIRRGLDDVKHGRTRSVKEFAQMMKEKFKIKRLNQKG